MTNSAQSTTFNYFVGTGSVLTDKTKSTHDLLPLQLGIFNSKNYKALDFQTSAKVVPEIIIAMGSPNEEKLAWTNAAMSFKSVPIRASKLIAWRKSTPKKPQNHKVAIGWDGTSDCKTIEALCDKTYTLFLQVEGSPATRFFGSKPLSDTFVVDTGCCVCDPNETSCSTDIEKFVDNFVTQINSSNLISPFVKAEKIVSYVTPPVLDTIDYSSYEITLCDEGGIADLANLQAAYPNASIVKTNRVGISSTYTLTQLASLPAPVDYSNQLVTTISNCTDCPTGYTLVPKAFKFKVQTQDAGTPADLATVAGGYADPLAYRLSYVNGESTYVISIATSTAPAPVTPGDIVTYIGTVDAFCELTTPTEFAWTLTKTLYKTKKELCLSIGDAPCDTLADTLQIADITSFYSNNPQVVPGSLSQFDNGVCANTYKVEIVSDNLMEEKCTTDIPVFSPLTPYKGFYWEDCCTSVTPNEVDKIGIILEGAYMDSKFGSCSFQYDDFVELEIPKIIVTQGDFVELDNKCSDRWPVTQLQLPVYPTGVGTNVKKDYIDIMSTKGQVWSDTPRWREIYGYNYDFINNNKYYKHFYLEFEALDKYFTSTGYGGNDFKQTIVFAFEETTDTSNFEKLLEGWIASERNDLIDSDPQDNLYR